VNLTRLCIKLAGLGRGGINLNGTDTTSSSLPGSPSRRMFLHYLVVAPLLGAPAVFGSLTGKRSVLSNSGPGRNSGAIPNTGRGDGFITTPERAHDPMRLRQSVTKEELIAQNTCIVPCVHRMHPYDVIPCQHVCYGPYGAVACHPAGDAVPCMHPVHPYGDYVPC
jgi:hypothetical protein